MSLVVRQEAFQRWKTGHFCEIVTTPSLEIPQGKEWLPYEEYMEAMLIDDCIPGKLGNLVVKFPSNTSENNRLHTHPASDRVITVIEGEGTFLCYRNREIQSYPLVAGVQVWMPKGILHT